MGTLNNQTLRSPDVTKCYGMCVCYVCAKKKRIYFLAMQMTRNAGKKKRSSCFAFAYHLPTSYTALTYDVCACGIL